MLSNSNNDDDDDDDPVANSSPQLNDDDDDDDDPVVKCDLNFDTSPLCLMMMMMMMIHCQCDLNFVASPPLLDDNDDDDDDDDGSRAVEKALCVGCGSEIHDPYILRVSPDLEWHAACLKCADCSQFLDETCTCFVRDGKTYCKRDYLR
ncbi:hypothetical protein JD844_014226 [Phrynosoma platyrhinos]|uniref:LIM zinc-binding domain-containing protein n=1 Tax=Phrynosoma platyrhinos TaxID=52577 RepID=A0ABQ7SRA4_PHRPL|nr:hypothetical protein JD844_014226 [Phrynosoma platyrhinos]